MATKTDGNDSKKRKESPETSQPPDRLKKPRAQGPQAQKAALIGPHESIVEELELKCEVLVASVLSSTGIRSRVVRAIEHLAVPSDKPRLVLLHARTAQVCKMITVVEQCKRVLSAQGKAWFQYNQLFDLPAASTKTDIVEETVLEKEDEDSDDDFQAMSSRFEKAVLPARPAQTVKSMRVFISCQPVPELKAKSNITVQASEETKT